MLPGFTGQLLRLFDPDAVAHSDEQVYRDLVSVLPEGVAAGDYTMSAQDKPAMVVTEATASAWGGTDLSVLRRNCDKVVPGAVAGSHPPSSIGICVPRKVREFADRESLFAALRQGTINAAWATTADPEIPSEFVALADRTALIRREPDPALPAQRTVRTADPRAQRDRRRARHWLAGGHAAQGRRGADARAVAEDFLQANPLGH